VEVKIVDTDSVSAITDALRGQDALIDASSGPDPTLQDRFVDAAVSAGVNRIVLSEFSVDPQIPEARSPLIFHAKNQAYEKAKKLAKDGKITYTTISNGAFLDWNLQTGFIKIDIFNKKVQYLNDGTLPFAWTKLSSVGAAVANVLKKAEQTENQSFYISSVYMSQKDMVDAAKKTLGERGWEETKLNMDQKLKEATTSMMAGKVDMEVIGNMILWSTATIASPRWEDLGDNKLLGVERLTDAELCKLIEDIATRQG
jgi:uncharacterized protein YbjT (DUF2867 family)